MNFGIKAVITILTASILAITVSLFQPYRTFVKDYLPPLNSGNSAVSDTIKDSAKSEKEVLEAHFLQ